MAELNSFQVDLKLPYFGGLSGTWVPDEKERKAAWELYVELITRISTVELRSDEGFLREALSSHYTIFGSTREILREYGPDIAQAKQGGDYSFGYLAVAVLNAVLRPLLAKWHPLLADYESDKPEAISRLEHENRWEHNQELRDALEDTRKSLSDYAQLLAKVADVPFIVVTREDDSSQNV